MPLGAGSGPPAVFGRGTDRAVGSEGTAGPPAPSVPATFILPMADVDSAPESLSALSSNEWGASSG